MNFTSTREDQQLIRRIVERARRDLPNAVPDPLMLYMDLTALHLNGCPLRLRELLEADDWNFLHDIGGISLHIERRTGELRDCFSPRYAEVK